MLARPQSGWVDGMLTVDIPFVLSILNLTSTLRELGEWDEATLRVDFFQRTVGEFFGPLLQDMTEDASNLLYRITECFSVDVRKAIHLYLKADGSYWTLQDWWNNWVDGENIPEMEAAYIPVVKAGLAIENLPV